MSRRYRSVRAARTGSATLELAGMKNERDARSVHSALSLIGGVTTVRVSLEKHRAQVAFDPDKVKPWQFQAAVKAVGCETK